MKVFDKVIPFLSERLSRSGSAILVGSHERIPVKRECFHSVVPQIGGKIVFIDGGNGEVLSGAEACVQFVRLCSVVYESNIRVERDVSEFFVVVSASQKGLDLGFDASVFNLDGDLLDKFSFDAFDPVLCSGGRRAEPSSVAGFVRKLLEFKLVNSVIQNLSAGDVVVRDGDLEPRGLLESLVRDIRVSAQKVGVVVLGLSKTSRLCTDVGSSAVRVLSGIAPVGCWFYYSGGSVGFAKLHPISKYVFRFDVFSHNRDFLPAVMSALAYNSQDPAFLGYPFGLLDADKFAQVPVSESENLRMHFAVKSQGIFDTVEFSVNAHDILDSL